MCQLLLAVLLRHGASYAEGQNHHTTISLTLLQVDPSGWDFKGNATGEISFTIESPPPLGSDTPRRSTVKVPLVARIEPTPQRNKRLLWDQFHSLKYPPGYIPRDNLDIKVTPRSLCGVL